MAKLELRLLQPQTWIALSNNESNHDRTLQKDQPQTIMVYSRPQVGWDAQAACLHRHGPACPPPVQALMPRQATGGPDKPGHDGARAVALSQPIWGLL